MLGMVPEKKEFSQNKEKVKKKVDNGYGDRHSKTVERSLKSGEQWSRCKKSI